MGEWKDRYGTKRTHRSPGLRSLQKRKSSRGHFIGIFQLSELSSKHAKEIVYFGHYFFYSVLE